MFTALQLQALRGMQRVLTCTWCNETLKDPRTMPCGHHFCAECGKDSVDERNGCSLCGISAFNNDLRENMGIAAILGHIRGLEALVGQAAQAEAAAGGGQRGGGGKRKRAEPAEAAAAGASAASAAASDAGEIVGDGEDEAAQPLGVPAAAADDAAVAAARRDTPPLQRQQHVLVAAAASPAAPAAAATTAAGPSPALAPAGGGALFPSARSPGPPVAARRASLRRSEFDFGTAQSSAPSATPPSQAPLQEALAAAAAASAAAAAAAATPAALAPNTDVTPGGRVMFRRRASGPASAPAGPTLASLGYLRGGVAHAAADGAAASSGARAPSLTPTTGDAPEATPGHVAADDAPPASGLIHASASPAPTQRTMATVAAALAAAQAAPSLATLVPAELADAGGSAAQAAPSLPTLAPADPVADAVMRGAPSQSTLLPAELADATGSPAQAATSLPALAPAEAGEAAAPAAQAAPSPSTLAPVEQTDALPSAAPVSPAGDPAADSSAAAAGAVNARVVELSARLQRATTVPLGGEPAPGHGGESAAHSSAGSSGSVRRSSARVLPGTRPPGSAAKPITMVGTALAGEELAALAAAVKVIRAGSRVSEAFEPGVTTHIVINDAKHGLGGRPAAASFLNQSGRVLCRRTLKYMQGVLCGCWVVTPAWLLECVKQGKHVPEAPFELFGDVKLSPDAAQGTPALGRARHALGAPGIFSGLRVVLRGPFDRIAVNELRSLVELGGGGVVDEADVGSDAGVVMVASKLMQAAAAAFKNAPPAPHPGPTVDQAWLLDSVSTHSMLPVGPPYVLLLPGQGGAGGAGGSAAAR